MNSKDHLKTEHQLRVEEFMRKAKQNLPGIPTEPSKEVRLLRAKLIFEECVNELIREGLGVQIRVSGSRAPLQELQLQFETMQANGDTILFNMKEMVDGCIDGSVVITGTLSACGVPDKPFLELVDKNNLAKFGPGHSIREDGKLIKPPGHQPPDIIGLLKTLNRDLEAEREALIQPLKSSIPGVQVSEGVRFKNVLSSPSVVCKKPLGHSYTRYCSICEMEPIHKTNSVGICTSCYMKHGEPKDATHS